MGDAGKQCGVDLISIVMNFANQDEVAPVRKENLQRFIDQMDRFSDHALAAGCRQGIVTSGLPLANTAAVSIVPGYDIE